jgi:hypothetical protein
MTRIIRSKSKWIFLVGLAIGVVMGNGGMAILGSSLQDDNTERLSINPYGALLDAGAEFRMTGFEAPIRLPGEGGVPNFSFGFSLPNNYLPNSKIQVQVLWETGDTGCSFVFGSNFMYRAGEGQPQDSGSPSGGFRPLDASTPHEIDGFAMTVEAPEDAHETAMLRFEVRTTAGEFDSLLSGDAVNISLGRLDRDDGDTCDGDVGIGGISIIYLTE